MADEIVPDPPPSESYAIERLRQRYGLLKVVVGTALVGVVAAALPAGIDFFRAQVARETSQRDFVREYTEYLQGDPEAQLALVLYFAHVLPEEEQRMLWRAYADHLIALADERAEAEAELALLAGTAEESGLAQIQALQRTLERLDSQLRPVVPGPAPAPCSTSKRFEELQSEYRALFEGMAVAAARVDEIASVAARIVAGRERYEAVAKATGAPWHVVGLLHYKETNFDFQLHLHNGDPLTSRTVRVPSGRPQEGAPPFRWEESAADAIRNYSLADQTDWSLERTLYRLERWNGFGYRPRGLCSPYLWGASDRYASGRFVGDGVFDPSAVDTRIGVAPVLRSLVEIGAVSLD